MSELPGFHNIRGATKFSELEMDKTFEESMNLLNQGKEYYVFPFGSMIFNREEQKILEWKDTENYYLFPIDESHFIDYEGMIVLNDGTDYITLSNITTIKNWNYPQYWYNVHTGKRSVFANFPERIELHQVEGILKIPPLFENSGTDMEIYALNCGLDISKADVFDLLRLNFSDPSETGKIIMNLDQKNRAEQEGRITEIEGILWFDEKVKVVISDE